MHTRAKTRRSRRIILLKYRVDQQTPEQMTFFSQDSYGLVALPLRQQHAARKYELTYREMHRPYHPEATILDL